MEREKATKVDRTARTVGHVECQKFDWRFEEVFRYQYHISRQSGDEIPIHRNWRDMSLNGWRIQCCPDLPASVVKDPQGRTLALILGIAITESGNCLSDIEIFDNKSDAFEDWLEALSGRFVALTFFEDKGRLYLDPAGNLSTVFDRNKAIIASSVYLVSNDEIQPHENIDSNLVLQRKEAFWFGETSDRQVTRARPNHYLRLDDFSECRHWPRDDTLFADLDQNRIERVKEVCDRLTRNISALTKAYSCGLPVTAGMDSRIVLACATPSIARIKSFYCYRLNQSTLIDAAAAVRLAEQIAVPMLILSRRSPTFKRALPRSFVEDEYAKMIARTGGCFGVRKDWAAYVAQTPPLDVALRGTGLEMTRANKWTDKNASTPCNSVLGLRALTGLRPGKRREAEAQKRYEYLLSKYEEWKNTLPEAAHERLYDLAHVELMLPSGPVLEYSAYATHFVVNPFNGRRLYQATAGISPNERMSGNIVRGIIAHQNKHLLSIPFHREWNRQ